MKYAKMLISALLWISCVLGCVSLSFGQPTPTPPPGINYQKVALLKWYPAIQTGATFTTGSHANGVAFDGANVWVANSNTVTKLRAADGVILGTFDLGSPWSLAFDGANIWVGQYYGGIVKLRASDGAILGTFDVGSALAMAFDGANIWAVSAFGNIVTKLRASDGTILGTYTVGDHPWGLAFDGGNIWVANWNSNTVSKLRASDGATLGTYETGYEPTFPI